MIPKIEEYCKRNKILDKHDKIIIGLSGGADSVCLFFILLSLKKKYCLTLQAVHIHHGIRGAEADQDAAFVKELCRQHQTPCIVEYHDVFSIAKQQSLSIEEAGRQVRYQAMERIRKELNFTKIAVAHHSNDQAETILFHLCRGSGLAGLVGIRPLNGVMIRPLLLVSRAEIEAFLRERNQVWCMDSTNLENNYSRNLLRNQVLPLLTEQINTDTVRHISYAGELLGEVYHYIREEAQRWAGKLMIRKEGSKSELEAEKLRLLAPLMRREIYRLLLEEQGGLRDISAVHLEQIDRLLFGTVGHRTSLPGKREAVRTYQTLLFLCREPIKQQREENQKRIRKQTAKGERTKTDQTARVERGERGQTEKNQKEVKQGISGFETVLEFGKQYVLPSGEVLLVGVPEEIEQFCQKNGIKREKIMEENPCTKCFDYDTIKDTLKLRTRETGDYLELKAGMGVKTLKRYLIDEKVPKEERDRIPLIAEGNHILWVIGYRMSAGYKVTDATRTILQIKISGGQ